VNNENGDLLADSHKIFHRWKNYSSQLLNVHNVREKYIQVNHQYLVTVIFEVEIATAVEKYKSPVSYQIPAELIQADGETLRSEIHKLSN
jgi:hypothetical protein